MNMPVFTYMTNTTFDELEMAALYIQMNDPSDHSAIDNLATALSAFS